MFDQLKGLFISSLRSQFYVSLYADMGRTVGFTGRCSGIHHVFPVNPVIRIPLVFRPFGIPRCFFGGNVFCHRLGGTQFLAQFQGVDRAVFHALAAGHTIILIHSCHIIGAYHIVIFEHFRGTQRKAAAAAAVADGMGFSGTVNIGNLMHQPVFLCLADNLKGFLSGNLASSSCLNVVFCRMAHLNTHIFFQMAAAFSHQLPVCPAGTVCHRENIIFIQIL